jgi:signal transduction histidine kinase
MAALPFRPTPFFGNKNRAFWRLQFMGWGGAMLLRAMSSIANAQPWSFLNRRPIVTWGVTAIAMSVAVGLYAFIDSWVISLYRQGGDASFAQLFVGVFYLDLTLVISWTGLYYAINFFLQVEEQNDQLMRLEAQATSAQLAMLRYQLNPHFLFNTLNSISTLVLLKQTEPANAMLSRLSSFLRYTLVNEPTARVTVAQEIETLKLYLDIERMRFEERLRTEFRIDDAVRNGLMPSLLLQPLVENAIKYAVSPMEYGAEITVGAQLVGPMLRVTVSDTGPGLPAGTDPSSVFGVSSDSTGIGLANIRDRLVQAYGENQRFDISNRPEGGFQVVIELPFEAKAEPVQAIPARRPPLVGAGVGA